MKLKKKHFFQLHSWIGTRLSILFFIVCFSGTIATLSSELDWLFIPESRLSGEGELVDKNEIVKNINESFPEGKINYWNFTEESYLCDIVYVEIDGYRNYVFVNPFTGKVQGSTRLTFQRFFRDLHYYLFIPFQIGHFTVLIFGFYYYYLSLQPFIFIKNGGENFLN
nr:PepSY-associated TM helix domain-containing protein [Psychroflexus tropicus]